MELMSASALAPSPFTVKDKMPVSNGMSIRSIKTIFYLSQNLKVKTKKFPQLFYPKKANGKKHYHAQYHNKYIKAYLAALQ